MNEKKLKQEEQTLRSLIKKARINILRKLLRDQKFWSAKLDGATVNPRAKKKLESTVAIVEYISAAKTTQLVKDVLRYQPPKNGAQVESGSVADRAVCRFRADAKLASHLRSLEGASNARGRKSALLLTIDKKRKLKKKPKATEAKSKQAQKGQKGAKGKGETAKATSNPRKVSNVDEELEEDQQNELDVSVSEAETSEDDDNIVEDDDDESESEASEDDAPEMMVSKPAKLATLKHVTGQPAKQQLKQATKKSLHNAKLPEDEDDELGSEFITDSFFLTDAGSSYVAVQPKLAQRDENPDGEQQDEETDEPWKISNKRKARQEQKKGSHADKGVLNGDAIGPVVKRTRRLDDVGTNADLHPSWAAKQRQKGIPQFVGKKVVFGEQGNTAPSTGESTEDLHPSWAAKQAQKGIKPFAGKKMVFDEDDDDGVSNSVVRPTSYTKPAADLHPSWAAKQAQKGIKPFTGKKMVFDADEGSSSNGRPTFSTKPESDLHPSWAAKQAQKGIKPFTGKKVVFGADDDFTTERTATVRSSSFGKKETDLHPSWAAKQAQKGIKPFAGKKVVFGADDDFAAEPTTTVRSSSYGNKEIDLHPSWAAKQAQKGIKPFAGKKVVFGADDDFAAEPTTTVRSSSYGNKETDLHPSGAAKQAQKGIKAFTGKKVVFGADDDFTTERTATVRSSFFGKKETDLHPSWAAKQAQKGIKPFAGKKVVFDGGEDGPPAFSKPASDLHPSWAAKQAQKGIKPFAGTKISFDDENVDTKPASSNGPRPTTDHHPSWAAKQAQSAIKPFAERPKKPDSLRDGTGPHLRRESRTPHIANGTAAQPQSRGSDMHPSWVAKQAQQGIKPFAGKKITFGDE